MIKVYTSKTMRELKHTRGSDSECNGITGVLDQPHNLVMSHVEDVDMVHCEYSVSYV